MGKRGSGCNTAVKQVYHDPEVVGSSPTGLFLFIFLFLF